MISNDPNSRNRSNDLENRSEYANSPDMDKDVAPDNIDNGIPDLDGDGFIGNTGGFYGGTSYLGSNYSWGIESERGEKTEGNYDAAGQNDFRTDEDQMNENSEDKYDR